MVDLIDFRKYRSFHQVPGTPEHVWHSFLNEKNLEKWLKADSREGMRARENHSFLWRLSNWTISGLIHKLDPYERIGFLWRIDEKLDRWPKGHYASAHMKLDDISGDNTYITLDVENYPHTEEEETRDFWDRHVIPNLSEYLKTKPDLEEAYAS